MTDAIRKKIESESIFAVENLFAKTVTYPESYSDFYQQGCAYGYNLAAEELAAKDKEIETLTRQVKAYKTLQKTGDEIRAHQSKLLSEAETVESEREANAILTEEIEKREKEIADLKDTVERMAARLQEMAQDTIKAQGHN